MHQLWKIWKKFKNNKKNMLDDQLIALRSNFVGSKFQWIKTEDLNLLGKIVVCKDVKLNYNNRFIMIFDDGSSVDSKELNDRLLMLHSDMPPLSIDEVLSINKNILNKKSQTNNNTENNTSSKEEKNKTFSISDNNSNVFDIFNKEKFDLLLKISTKLPNKKLLKMMYENAQDKKKFINDLSSYIYNLITVDIIKESVLDILNSQSNKNKKENKIELIKINHDE